MRPKSLAVLMFALGCGLVAAIGITEFVSRRNNEVPTDHGSNPADFRGNDRHWDGEQLSVRRC